MPSTTWCVADDEAREAHHVTFCSLGSSASRRPSPTICSDSTVSTIAKPGSRISHSAWPKYCWRAGDHVAPGRRRRAARRRRERTTPASVSIAAGEDEGGLHDQRRDQVRQQVDEHDARVAGAERPRGLDELQLAQHQRRRAHHAGRRAACRRSPSASTTSRSEAPSAAMSAIASRMSGNAISASVNRISSAVEPADIAGRRPSTRAERRRTRRRRGRRRRATAARRRCTRESTSRPNSSVPSQCGAPRRLRAGGRCPSAAAS